MTSIFFPAASQSASTTFADTQPDTKKMSTPADTRFETASPTDQQNAGGQRSHRRAWAAGIAFFTTVFASMAAAATVASSDFPLMIVGL
ncbi:MAG: hypothetical protein Q7T87_07600 [Polaromonas sp.]|nr:hypothetical protein [Polaromonas sp.]